METLNISKNLKDLRKIKENRSFLMLNNKPSAYDLSIIFSKLNKDKLIK
jgi:hypothetical protein